VAASIGAATALASLDGPLVRAQIPDTNVPALLVSRQLAEAESLAVGDTVRISANPDGSQPRTFFVAGVYEPVADPMRFTARRHEVRLHLPDLLELTADPEDPLSRESVTSINLALADPADAERVSRELSAKVPGLIVRPAVRSGDSANVFVVIERFHQAIALVTVIASAVFLLALMVMLADERRGVVGTLRLIGLTRNRVILQVFTEGLLIAVAGAAFGVLFAAATEGAFNRFFQWRYDTALVFVRITPRVALQSIAIAVPLGLLASVAASWTLLRREVLTLVRR